MVSSDRVCSICSLEIEGTGDRLEGVPNHWECARLARWRINHPGEPDPWWADPRLPIPERLKLEPLRTFAMRRIEGQRWRLRR